MEDWQFIGAPVFDDHGRLFIPDNDDLTYVGEPRPELDEAWDNLTRGM